jgi:hypothetical protein
MSTPAPLQVVIVLCGRVPNTSKNQKSKIKDHQK